MKELFVKVVNDFKSLIISTKRSIDIYVWQGAKYASAEIMT